jgi:HNH endonuclease/EVE domain-containing protein
VNYWVLKGRPGNTDWKNWLWPGNEVREGTAKSVSALRTGDRVFYWKSSPARCLVALGRVTDVRHAKERGRRTETKVRVLTKEFDPPIGIAQLRKVVSLGNPSFLKSGAPGTYYPLTTEQAVILYHLSIINSPAYRTVWHDLPAPSGAFRKKWLPLLRPGAYKKNGYLKTPKNDPDKKQVAARRVRAGAGQFRTGLLELYGGRCAVGGSAPKQALDACHIDPHMRTGNNDYSNGLVLRADIHNLFDAGMITIHPSSLRIFCDPKLKGTNYWRFNGKKAITPSGKWKPAAKFLKIKWDYAHPE